jgi:hypothetical protein
MYEDFSSVGYTGSLDGDTTSATGVTGSWDEAGTAVAVNVGFNHVSSGLTFTQGLNQLTTSGGAVNAFRTSGLASGKSIQLESSPFTTSLNEEVWMSLLVDYDGTPVTGSAMMGVSINDGNPLTVPRSFGIGIDGGVVGAYQGNNQDMPDSGLDAEALTGLSLLTGINLIVARVANGSPDSMEVWLNPTLGGATPTSGASVTLDGFGWVGSNASWGVNSLFVSHNLDTGSDVTLDEFRYGASFADVTPFTVIPEPSSLAMLALSGVAMFFACKRRR